MSKLVNIHPFFAENFLTLGVKESPSKEVLDPDVSTLKFEYPNVLQKTYSRLTKINDVPLSSEFAVSIYYLSDGLFCFVTTRELDKIPRHFDVIVEIADVERDKLEKCLLLDDTKRKLNKLVGSKSQSTDQQNYKLGFGYSHNLFVSDTEKLPSTLMDTKSAFSTHNEYFAFAVATSALNIFSDSRHHVPQLESYLINLTTLMGTLYEIQEAAMSVSRQLIQSGYEKKDLAVSVSDFERRVGYFEQFVAEIRLVDFLSDPFEETLGETTARAWDWNSLVRKTSESITHMATQVEKLSNEVQRRSDKKLNHILFAFTFLTVMEVTGSIISLYDPENNIVPIVRLATVIAAVVMAVFVANLYLLKGSGRHLK